MIQGIDDTPAWKKKDTEEKPHKNPKSMKKGFTL